MVAMLFDNIRFDKVAVLAVFLSFVGFPLLVMAAINDPTKPIYSENANSLIVTNPVIVEKKVVLLQSIFFSDKNKVAILNGEAFKEGDLIDDVFMESIQKNHVIIKYKEHSTRLTLSKKIYLDNVTGEISE
jgi:hypothetical protein